MSFKFLLFGSMLCLTGTAPVIYKCCLSEDGKSEQQEKISQIKESQEHGNIGDIVLGDSKNPWWSLI